MEGRARWTDDRLDDFVGYTNRAINGIPDRVSKIESKLGELDDDVRECKAEIKGHRADFTASRQGMSRPEKIALGGVAVAFGGVLASGLAVLL